MYQAALDSSQFMCFLASSPHLGPDQPPLIVISARKQPQIYTNTVTCDIGEGCERTIHLAEKTFIGVKSSLSVLPIQGSFGPGLLMYKFRDLRIETFNVREIFLPKWHLGRSQQRFENCGGIILSRASVTCFRITPWNDNSPTDVQSFIHMLFDLND